MKRNAFTLPELLIVIMILGVLAAIVIPRLPKAPTSKAEQFAKDPANISIYVEGKDGFGWEYTLYKKTWRYTEITYKSPNGYAFILRNMNSVLEDPCMIIGNHPGDFYEMKKGGTRIIYAKGGVQKYLWEGEAPSLDEGLREGTELFNHLWREILTEEGYIAEPNDANSR